MTYPSPTYSMVTLEGPLNLDEWTTATRPTSPANGATGFNTTIGSVETWNGTAWGSGGGGVSSVIGNTGSVTLAEMVAGGLAPLDSPAFINNPTAPTPALTDNDTSIATTAYVTAKVAAATAGVSTVVGNAGAVTLAQLVAGGVASATSVSVLDFGADPTGSTDSTTAINAAQATGKKVVFPHGTFNVTALNGPTSGQYFVGAGIDATTIRSTSTTADVFLISNGVSFAGISDMTITRTVTPVSGASGIQTSMSGANDVVTEIYLQRLHLTNHWNGLLLGPTSFSMVRDIMVESCLDDGILMKNTVGTSSVQSQPLQWTFDHVAIEFCHGHGIAVLGVAMAAGTTSVMPLGEWKNVSTFANTGGGASVVGNSTCRISDFRLGSNSFLGADGNNEIFLDTWGSNHKIEAFLELPGTAPTGVGMATAASNIGRGIQISANNSGVLIHGSIINGCSDEGIATQANLYGAATAPTSVTGCQITNNGLAGVSGAQSGIIVTGGGGLVVTGGMIGQWNTAPGTGTQKYGISAGVDNIAVSGCRFFNNATAAINSLVTLTSNSYLDTLAGGSSGGSVFTPTAAGIVPASGGGTTNFLRADGTWTTAGGTAGVSSFNSRTGAIILTNADVAAAVVSAPLFCPTASGITGPGDLGVIMQTDGMLIGMNDTGAFSQFKWSTASLFWEWLYNSGPQMTLDHVGLLSLNTGISGQITGVNAPAGVVGEYISASVASTSAVALTTNIAANVTSIPLTAGDWDVEGSVGFIPNASTVLGTVIGGIGQTSATLPADPGTGARFVLQGSAGTGISTGGILEFATGRTRVNVPSATTVFLVAQANFTTSTCGAFGFISARRVR